MVRLLVACVALAVIAGVHASVSRSRAPTVVCGSIVVPTGPFTWRPERVVLGVVAVPPAHIPQTVESGGARWPFWSKAGIVIRAGSPPVVVSVPKTWRTRAAIGWGNVDASATVRFETCPDSSSLGGWNPYSGGFQLRARAACVPLTFRVGDRSATVRFGVGKRCG
jgi:hypothetical protein